MNSNQTKQQIKSDPRGKAIASLILGIVSIITITIIGTPLLAISLIGTPFIAIIGVIFGILGLKSKKRNLAIIGIIFSIIGFIISVYFYYNALFWKM